MTSDSSVHTMRAVHSAYRSWSVRTVVVRLSRKLSATYRIRSGRRLSQLLAALLATVSPWAAALPEGAQVVAGQASVTSSTANTMVVNQSTDKAVLNWQSFNIGAGQSMQFVQPGASSVALNRVIGNGASAIFGSLSANGQVFLINPSGVMFAPGAQVNVGGLVASSLDIGNSDFMAGRYSFSGGGTGAVSNHGNINAARGGYVLLAGPQVSNTGAISAEAGSVGLLAGSRVSVDTSGAGLVRFSVDAAAAQAAIQSSGSITANGGQVAVLASALGDAMATVVNHSGVIRANSAVERNGTIVLSGGATGIVNVSGELSAAGTASGQMGGMVKVLGDKVALTGSALIDVSGQAGGGTALIGGDYQGINAAVQNANRTYIGANTSIKADALNNGNGGKVIVWADDVTQFHGSITAKGGAQGGDGGFVETSGKAVLQALGSVDASAPNGAAGQWLLDPNNITIQTAGPDTNVSATPNFTSTNDTAIVIIGSIVTALNGGTSVNITTASAGTNGQVGDITVANAIAKTAGGAATLTLNASNNITFNTGANITSTVGALGVTLNAGGAINSLRNVSLNGGTLNLNATGNVTQSAGAIQGTTALVKNGAGTLTLSGTNTYSGGTTIKAGTVSGTVASAFGTGAITLGDSSGSANATLSGRAAHTNAINVAAGNTGVATITSSANSTFSGAVTLNNHDLRLAPAANTLTLSGGVTGTGNLVMNSTGAGVVTLSTVSVNNAGTISNTGTGAASNVISAAVGANVTGITENSATSALTVSGALTVNSGGTTLTNSNASGTRLLTVSGGVSGTGNLVLNNNSAILGGITLSATAVNNAGMISNTGIGSGAATISAAVGANVTGITENSATSALTVSGALTVNGAGTTLTNSNAGGVALLTVSGGVSGTGNLVLNNNSAIANGITLSGTTANNIGTITNSGTGTGAALISKVIGTNVTGVVQNSATSQLTLSGANTYSTGTTIKAGTVSGTTSANAFGMGAITLGDSSGSANATLNGGFVGTHANAINVATGNTGVASITSSAASIFSGAVTLNNHDLSLTRAGANLTLSGGVTGTGNLSLNNSSTTANGLTLSGASVNNTGTITNSGTGTGATLISKVIGTNVTGVVQNSATSQLTLSAANTYVGGTTIKAGTVSGTNVAAFGAGVITLGDSSGGANATLSGGAAHTNAINVAAGNTGVASITSSATSTFSGAVMLNNHDLRLVRAGANLTLSGGITGTGNLSLNNNSATASGLTLSGAAVNNIGTITNSGTGTGATLISKIIGTNVTGVVQNSATSQLTLSGANTYSGGTTIKAGTVSGTVASAFGTGVITLGDSSGSANATLSGGAAHTNAINVAAGNTGVASITSSANSTFSGAVTLNNHDLRLAPAANTLTLSGAVTGTGNLTLNTTGAGTITLSGAGTLNNTGTVTNGGTGAGASTISKVIGTNVTGVTQSSPTSQLTLSGVNTYTGATAVNAGTLRLGVTNAIGAASAVSVLSGATFNLNGFSDTVASVSSAGLVAFGAGNTLTTSGAQTYTGQVTGNNVTLVSNGGGAITANNVSNNFAGNLSVSTSGAASVVNAGALALGPVSASSLTARALGGNLTLNGNITASGSGDAIVLTTSGNFANNASAGALATPSGRWLVYSTSPVLDTKGGLTAAFKQYNATYGSALLGTGNGFVHSVAPAISVGLIGTVSKVYDGNVTATLTAGNYTTSGDIDGDVIAFNNPTSGSYDNKNAGTGKTVTVSGITATASNGATTVYGYQVSGGGTATGNIGTITARNLTVTAAGTNKVYDGNTTAGVTLADNRVAGDVLTATNTSASFGDKNVGTSKAVSVSGIAVTGTDAGNYTFNTTAATAADITQRALTVSATAQNKVYDGGTAATVMLGDNRVAGDVLATSNTSASFVDKNAGVGKTVNVGGIAITGTDAGNYGVNATTATTANITPASIANVSGITAVSKMQDGTTVATLATGGAAFAGRIGADVLTVGAATGNFDTPAVGNGKPVSITGITLSGTDAGNYILLDATAAATANITPAPANMVGRTGDARIANGTALSVLEADDGREQALRRAPGLRNRGSVGAAEEPLFRLAGFSDARSVVNPGADDCTGVAPGASCVGGPSADQGQ